MVGRGLETMKSINYKLVSAPNRSKLDDGRRNHDDPHLLRPYSRPLSHKKPLSTEKMVEEVDLLLLSTREGLSASVRDDRRVQLGDAHSVEIGASAR